MNVDCGYFRKVKSEINRLKQFKNLNLSLSLSLQKLHFDTRDDINLRL